jgi:hypothetical protein
MKKARLLDISISIFTNEPDKTEKHRCPFEWTLQLGFGDGDLGTSIGLLLPFLNEA